MSGQLLRALFPFSTDILVPATVCRCKALGANGRATKCVAYIDKDVAMDSIRARDVTINMNGSIGARGSVNSKTELIGILRTLPGGDSNVPSSWRARPPVTTGTKRKGV